MNHDCAAISTGVIIAGAGLAGCCAALAAAEAGTRVHLLEKMPAAGGSSRLSGGGFAFAGIAPQRDAGIEDSPGLLRADMDRMGRGFNDPALADVYVARQADTYEWLCTQGVRFTTLQAGSGNSVPRVLRTDTSQLFAALLDAVDRNPLITFHTGAAVERLLRDPASGTVHGARVAMEGKTADLRCAAVVLATGGFSRAADLVGIFAPAMLAAVPVGGDGSSGDGLRMACALGAGLRDMGFVRATFGSHPSAAGAQNMMLFPIYKGGIIVNKLGRRFVDESRPYKELGDKVLAQPDVLGFQVFDQQVMDKADRLSVTYDFPTALERGLIIKASTLRELAAAIGIDASELEHSVTAYNDAMARGLPDSMGRTGLPGGFPLTSIDTGPFYAYPSGVVLLATYCGLSIDREARVLDTFGEPISGLYAAGELTGGVHGAGYLSGSSLGKSAIFGRVAGASAAAASAAAALAHGSVAL